MIKGFIFDVDGVLVNSPHERAWGDTLANLVNEKWPEVVEKTGYSPDKYTPEVYQKFVSGKPRTEGAASLLAYFEIEDNDGEKCKMLCDEKQGMILQLIDEGKFEAYADALRFLLKAKANGGLVAAASSSKNANHMMSKVDIYEFCKEQGLSYDFVKPSMKLVDIFDANVCGREFKQGKPHPEIFLTAGELLGTEPSVSLVVEDAPSGVLAAKAAKMYCIGISRADDEDLLKAANADWVVKSLDEIDPSSI